MAGGYDGRGSNFPLTIVDGADMAFQLTATTDAAVAIDLSAATIAGELYNAAGTVVDTFGAVVSGAGSNVVTLSLTDTETALLSGVKRWTLWVTRGSDKRPWLAGPATVVDGTRGRSATTGNFTLEVDTDVNVAVTVYGGSGGGGSSVTIQATAPSDPTVGDLWADSDDLALYTYYNDGDSSQWVAIGGPAGADGAGGSTNLTWTASTSTIASDTGTDAVLTAVDGTNAGLMTVALKSKLDGIEAGADVTDATNVSAAGAPIISSGAGAPGSTPSKVGDVYIDTTNDDAYTAVGTASSADWEKHNDGGGGGSVATDTIFDAKGDLAVGTGANTSARLAVGVTNGHVLTIDSAEATGLKWAAASAGGGTDLGVVTAATSGLTRTF